MKNLFLFFYNFFENYIHLRRIKSFLSEKVELNDPIIFDVGSHQGKLAKLMYDLYENSIIYCFEPNKSMNKYLKKIGNNIKVYNCALGEKNEKKKILINKIDLTNTLSSINENSLYLKIKNFILAKSKKDDIYEPIQVISLENFCNEKKIKYIDFLKLDVEGYEYNVLQGAKNIIKNVKFVMLEIQKNNMYNDYSKKNIEVFLKENNFILIKTFKFPFMFFEDRIYKRVQN